jgi:hypothetical protein
MNDDEEFYTPEQEAAPLVPDDRWEDDTVLPPMHTTTYMRHGTRIIASQPRPTTNTNHNTQPEEAPEMNHGDMYAEREANDQVGVIQSWYAGHAPGATHISIQDVALAASIAHYGEQRGHHPTNKRNALKAVRDRIMTLAAKDDMTRLNKKDDDMTVVLDTSEWVSPNRAWLSWADQIRFFTLTDLDTRFERIAGHPVELVAVLFSPRPEKARDYRANEGWIKIPSDYDAAAYINIVGVWQHDEEGAEARNELAEAVMAQIKANRSADRDDDTDVDHDEDGDVRTYYVPVNELGHL